MDDVIWTVDAQAHALRNGFWLDLAGTMLFIILWPALFIAFVRLYYHTWNRVNLVAAGTSPFLAFIIVMTPLQSFIYYGINTKILGMHLNIASIMPSTCKMARTLHPDGAHLPCFFATMTRLINIVLGGPRPWQSAAETSSMINFAACCFLCIIFILAAGSIAWSPVWYPKCPGCGCSFSVSHFQFASQGRWWRKTVQQCKICHQDGASEKTQAGSEESPMVWVDDEV